MNRVAALAGAFFSMAASMVGFPLRFERGAGADVYVARGDGYKLRFEEDGIGLSFAGGAVGKVSFAGASRGARIEALEALPTLVNDYTGPRAGWVSGAACWSQVRYSGLYPGVDLVFYGQGDEAEYDVRVAAGADPGRVRLAFDSSFQVRVDAWGDLTIERADGVLRWRKPVAYQTIGGRRRGVEAGFALEGSSVGFRVGGWDRRYPLTIDPAMVFSTFFGGSMKQAARAIATDSAGNIYIAGSTNSGDLPVTKASYQPDFRGSGFGPGDAFLAKLNPAGTAVLYVTYLGGTDSDVAAAIAVDSAGNAYVAGGTMSTDFPVTAGAYQTHFGGGDGNLSADGDAFLAKFNATGQLQWSTYLGGAGDEGASAIALDASGNVFVAGATTSANFPVTAGAYQTRFGGATRAVVDSDGYFTVPFGDGFVAKVDAGGAHLLAATYLGGTLDDAILAMAFDGTGNVWVGGGTNSSNFPVTAGAFQKTFAGASDANTQFIDTMGDGFLAGLTPDLAKLTYSTYFGGSRDDAVTAMAIDRSNAIYLAGVTQSSNFPATAGAYSTAYHGPAEPLLKRPYLLGDAFAAKFQAGGAGLVYSTYLGGADDDAAAAIALDGQGGVLLAGMTNSVNFPVSADALQAKFGGSGSGLLTGVGDGFVAHLDGTGSKLLYSSFLGGSLHDAALGMTEDAAGNVYVTGLSASANFLSTAGVLQAKLPGTLGSFVAKFAGLASSTTAPAIRAVTNAASYSKNAIAPGELVTIFGANLGPATLTYGPVDSSTGKIVTEVAGAQILFNGIPGPIIYVAAGQASAVVPFEVTGTAVQVQVTYISATSAPFSVPWAAANPGLFSANSSGSGPGAILNVAANGTTSGNSPANPAAEESYIVLYGTGGGQTAPASVDGALAGTPLPQYSPLPTVTFDGKIAATDVTYAGDAPGIVEGVFQIDVKLPAGLGAGTHTIAVSFGGVASQSGLTVAVK